LKRPSLTFLSGPPEDIPDREWLIIAELCLLPAFEELHFRYPPKKGDYCHTGIAPYQERNAALFASRLP